MRQVFDTLGRVQNKTVVTDAFKGEDLNHYRSVLAKHGVPVHVISRRAAFLEPFLARGYERGLRPAPGGARLPMETLLLYLLQDFSMG